MTAGKRCALEEDHRTPSGLHVRKRESRRRNGGPHPRCGVEGACSAIFPFSAGPRAFALRSFSSGDLASQSTKDG